MKRAVLIIILAAVAGTACGKDNSPTAPSVNVPFSTVDLRAGTGAEATAGRTANVNYALWLYNSAGVDNKGRQIQSGNFSFLVGSTQTIAGFNQGVTGMRVGGLRRIVVPPSLGYGNNPPSSDIPPNATLIFEVELLSIQ